MTDTIAVEAWLTWPGAPPVASPWEYEVLDGQLAFNREWTPFAQATVVIAGPSHIPVEKFTRMDVLIRCTDIATGGYTQKWHALFLTGWTSDVATDTYTLRLASMESLLQNVRNGGPAWMPVGSGFRDLVELWNELFDHIDTALRPHLLASAVGTLPSIDLADVEPWMPGDSAWAWLNRYRQMLDASYEPYAGQNVELRAGTLLPLGDPAPGTLIEQSSTMWPDAYADNVVIHWQWRDPATGEQLEQQTQDDGNGWRGNGDVLEVDLLGPPVPGYADRVRDNRVRLRVGFEFSQSYTLDLVAYTPTVRPDPLGWMTCTYVFGDQPHIRGSYYRLN